MSELPLETTRFIRIWSIWSKSGFTRAHLVLVRAPLVFDPDPPVSIRGLNDSVYKHSEPFRNYPDHEINLGGPSGFIHILRLIWEA